MTNSELQALLSAYPPDMPVMYLDYDGNKVEFTGESLIETTDTAFIDEDAPEDEWDHEDGKIELGSGERHILLNAMIY